MKKIVYISVYRDGTGYGNAALLMIKALAKTGYEVVPVWMTLNGHPNKIDYEIANMESSNLDGVDIVIQQTLPSMFVRIEGVKNIGFFFWETDKFTGSGWQHGCNLMDEIWVTTEEQREACLTSGVTKPIILVDQPKDIDPNKETMFDFRNSGVEHCYKFYTISDFSNKKNVNGLIHSFLTEFSVDDQACLVLKTYISRAKPEESLAQIKKTIEEIKHQIGKKLEIFPRIVIIPKMVSDMELESIENACDCFVSMSRGEGEGLPMAQAAIKGKPVIAPNISGIKKNFINKDLLVTSTIKKRVFGMKNEGGSIFYLSDENWYDPSTNQMCEKMRLVFNGGEVVENSVKENQEHIINNYSIDVCSEKLKNLL